MVALPALRLLVIFYFWERRWDRLGRETLIDLALLKVRSYMFGLTLGTFYFAGFTAIFLVTTLYLQVGLHYTALQAGATQTPFAIGSAIAATLGSRLVPRFGRALVVAGLVLVAAGLLIIDLLVPHLYQHGGLEAGPGPAARRLRWRPGDQPERDPDAGRGGPAPGRVGRRHAADRSAGGLGHRRRPGARAVLRPTGWVDGDNYPAALSTSLRTTIGFILVALVFGVARPDPPPDERGVRLDILGPCPTRTAATCQPCSCSSGHRRPGPADGAAGLLHLAFEGLLRRGGWSATAAATSRTRSSAATSGRR